MDGIPQLHAAGRRLAEPEIAQPVKVLCVDDLMANLVSLEVTLEDLDLQLVKASSGAQALGFLLKEDFALILLDVKMPVMDGFETAELIRQRKRSQHIPIIFLTASERDDVQVFKGYALGAVDYLCKPLIPQILRSKVAVFVDMYRKTEQVKAQAEQLRRLEYEEYQRQLTAAQERFEAERLRQAIFLARQIQQKLFPVARQPSSCFDISGASVPADATGGDYFDYIPMRDALAVAIGDVSGHGLGPALLMAAVRAYLRALLRTCDDVAEIVSLLNSSLAEDAPDGYFATLLLVRLDAQTRSVVYVSAGHVPGYVLSAAGDVKAVLNSTGLPLAVLPDGEFPAVESQPLAAGDLLLLVTDGILEACDSANNQFGIERVLEAVRLRRSQTASKIVDGLFADVRGFCTTKAQLDDMTAVVIKAIE
jgi:serine phosphatase RsbU (regulator of sigma subunit)